MRIVFPVSSAPGPRPQSGSGRLKNAYATKTEQGSRSPLKWSRSAGLRELFDVVDHVHFRGGIEVGSTFIAVLDDRVYTVTESGGAFTATNQGVLAGTDAVTIAQNNADTPDIVCVADAGAFNLFTDSAPTSFADGDLPSSNSVSVVNGYFVWTTGGGEIWASDLNSVDVASNSFESAEMPLRRGVAFRGEFFAFGETKTKVYEEVGTSPFPLRNKKIEITCGIIGTHAVAGFEEGAAGELLWVSDDNLVRRLNGYAADIVSNEDVSAAIASASDRTLIEASVYMNGKNLFFVITSPGEWTWELNVTTGSWTERESYQADDWRGRRCIRAFDRWIAGDAETGKFGAIDPTYKREYGDPLIFHVESGDNASFPYPIEVGSAHFDFAMGVGNAAGDDPIETDPVAMISASFDGGYSWGNEVRRTLGAQGQGWASCFINRVGTTRGGKGVRFKVRVSDPVDVVFFGGEMPEVQARAA